MSNEQILTKAIEKAFNDGFGFKYAKNEDLTPIMTDNRFYPIIFSHPFARAFWGEEAFTEGLRVDEPTPIAWQYHLQQMVLEEEPLQYLKKFL